MTCSACPQQYEGTTTDNRPIYVRFRHGHLEVLVGDPGEDVMAAIRRSFDGDLEPVISWEVPDYDGWMPEETMATYLSAALEMPA